MGVGRAGDDFVGMVDEDAAFCAGEVVLREFSDLFEEVGADFVVEEPGGEGFWGGGEADSGVVGYGLDDAEGWFWCEDGCHLTPSLARRRPENCQRVDGEKKLR